MSNEEMKIRLECLKLSYEVNFKIGNLKDSYLSKDDMTPNEIIHFDKIDEAMEKIKIYNTRDINKDLRDVFSLADMHLQYVIYGKIPLDDEEGENESDSI